jgi:hypothetical protein
MAARRVGSESESAAERLADPIPEAGERHPTGGGWWRAGAYIGCCGTKPKVRSKRLA